MSERAIQTAILARLGARPNLCRVWRQNTGVAKNVSTGQVVRFGIPGQADITGMLVDGRRLEIEVKGPKGVQSDEQKAFQAMVERFGGVYLLCRSAEEAVRGVLDALER